MLNTGEAVVKEADSVLRVWVVNIFPEVIGSVSRDKTEFTFFDSIILEACYIQCVLWKFVFINEFLKQWNGLHSVKRYDAHFENSTLRGEQ